MGVCLGVYLWNLAGKEGYDRFQGRGVTLFIDVAGTVTFVEDIFLPIFFYKARMVG